MPETEERNGSTETVLAYEADNTANDAGGADNSSVGSEETEVVANKEETISKSEYERKLKELENLSSLYGRQTEELGELRAKVSILSTPKAETPKEEKDMTGEEKLALLTNDPDKYEEYILTKAEKRAYAKIKKDLDDKETERELYESYPEIKDKNSALFQETLKVMRERPMVFQDKKSYVLAAEIAKHRLTKPEDLIAKGRMEAKNNIRVKTQEVAMETKATGTPLKPANPLGRPLTDKEAKFLKNLGVSLEDLSEEVTFDKARSKKGGK